MDWIRDHLWETWLALSITLGVAEMFSLDLVLAMLAAGAVVGMVAALVGLPFVAQILLALGASVAALALVRPAFVKRLHAGPELSLGHGKLVGTRGLVTEEITGLSPAVIEESTIPRVTYCDPEIASVGLTETQAAEKYGDVETYEYNLGGNGKSQILGTQGFVKLVRQKDGPVVGVHMVGARMGEQVGEAQLIVGWEAFPEDVASLVHAHPTQNEALGEAHLALAGKPLHAHS